MGDAERGNNSQIKVRKKERVQKVDGEREPKEKVNDNEREKEIEKEREREKLNV